MLRAGFIGFGRMGITHFSILNTHPAVKIVAICDPSKSMKGSKYNKRWKLYVNSKIEIDEI